jgi:hypothetical protein
LLSRIAITIGACSHRGTAPIFYRCWHLERSYANKYMAASRGIFEMKFFFTSVIAATDGGEAHSAAARNPHVVFFRVARRLGPALAVDKHAGGGHRGFPRERGDDRR